MKKILILYFASFFNLLFASQDRIDFFDVGQGHCALVTRVGLPSSGQVYYPLLIDAGSKGGLPILVEGIRQTDLKCTDKGKETYLVPQIVETLKQHWGNTVLHLPVHNQIYGLNIIISHEDEDHCNMLEAILTDVLHWIRRVDDQNKQINIIFGGTNKWYSPAPAYANVVNCYYPAADFQFSERAVDDISHIEFWQTPPDFVAALKQSGCVDNIFIPGRNYIQRVTTDLKNRPSIVTKIKLPGISALITGDAPLETQKTLCRLYGTRLPADILLYPHHGSHKLDEQFLELVNPISIVISARYGGNRVHPLPAAMEDLINNHRELRYHQHIATKHCIELPAPPGAPCAIRGLRGVTSKVPEAREVIQTDKPIFTTSTCGRLLFTKDAANPVFMQLAIPPKGSCLGHCDDSKKLLIEHSRANAIEQANLDKLFETPHHVTSQHLAYELLIESYFEQYASEKQRLLDSSTVHFLQKLWAEYIEQIAIDMYEVRAKKQDLYQERVMNIAQSENLESIKITDAQVEDQAVNTEDKAEAEAHESDAKLSSGPNASAVVNAEIPADTLTCGHVKLEAISNEDKVEGAAKAADDVEGKTTDAKCTVSEESGEVKADVVSDTSDCKIKEYGESAEKIEICGKTDEYLSPGAAYSPPSTVIMSPESTASQGQAATSGSLLGPVAKALSRQFLDIPIQQATSAGSPYSVISATSSNLPPTISPVETPAYMVPNAPPSLSVSVVGSQGNLVQARVPAMSADEVRTKIRSLGWSQRAIGNAAWVSQPDVSHFLRDAGFLELKRLVMGREQETHRIEEREMSADEVRIKIRSLGWSQIEIGNAAGVSQPTVSCFLNNVGFYELQRFAMELVQKEKEQASAIRR